MYNKYLVRNTRLLRYEPPLDLGPRPWRRKPRAEPRGETAAKVEAQDRGGSYHIFLST